MRVTAAVVVVLLSTSAVHGTQLLRGRLRVVDVGCAVSAVSVSFGSYDPFNPNPTDGNGTITYVCGAQTSRLRRVRSSSPANLRIEISPGANRNFDRMMSVPDGSLRYNVYLDAARQTIWGDGTNGTEVLLHAAPENQVTYTVPVYTRIFPRQAVAAGSYSDALMVTISWSVSGN